MYSCRIVYDSSRHRLRHPPSPRNTKKFTTLAVTDHAAACFSQQTRSATVGQVCRTGVTSIELLIDFSFFDFGGLTPRPKVTKRGDDLLSTKIYHPTKFQPDRANGLRDMRYQSFSLFGPWGLIPGPKFTKRGEDLADTEIYTE